MAQNTKNAMSCHAEVLSFLDRSVEVATRVSGLYTSDTVDDGPLAALLRNEIKSYTRIVCCLRSEFLAFVQEVYINPLGIQDSSLPERLSDALLVAKLRLFELLELIDFSQREETRGQDGALNARFAETYILNRNVDHYKDVSYLNEDKMLRDGLALRDLLCDMTMDLTPPGTLQPQEAVQRFQQFQYSNPFSLPMLKRLLANNISWRPLIESWVAQSSAQHHPRYVHTYSSLSEVPYVVDPTGLAFSGSYGTVQKVNHEQRVQPLAMKSFHNVFKGNATRKVLREIGVLEACHHKNIVRLVEAFKVDEEEHCIRLVIKPWAPYTLTNFLHATDLGRKKRCPWFEPSSVRSDACIGRIMYELVDAVRYLHGRSIKHKDLKPDNILLHQEATDRVTPFITDVGISKVYIHGASTNPQDSTWAYLSPEQHAGTGCTLKSDIWQLGCCLAELVGMSVGGTATYQLLHASFNRDEEDCSCSIALEKTQFSETLAGLCLRGNTMQKKAFGIISGMLENDAATRLDVESVWAAMSKFSGSHT